MRKEILLAIVVGVLVGLGLTFGLYLLRQHFGRPSSTVRQIEESRQGSNSALNEDDNNQSLIIQQPQPDTFTSNAELRVVGRAIPSSYIVILVGTQEFITTADTDGDFSQTVEVAAGGNRITIIATSPDGVQESVVRSVVFSASDLSAPASSPSASATGSARTTPAPTTRPTATPNPAGGAQ